MRKLLFTLLFSCISACAFGQTTLRLDDSTGYNLTQTVQNLGDTARTFEWPGTNGSVGQVLTVNAVTATHRSLLSWAGSSTTIGNYVAIEFPSGTINGTNKSFTLANTPSLDYDGNPALSLYLNNGYLINGIDFTISGAGISMNYAPLTGDRLTATYFISLAGYYIAGETPSGSINGTNVDFSLAYTPANDAEGNPSIMLFLNNGYLIRGIDYTISGTAIVLNYAPLTGDYLRAIYYK
jgi:hypothetical protein